MDISGIGSQFVTGDLNRTSVSRVDSVSSLKVSNPRLSAIIGDSVEVSDAAKSVSEAFADFSNVDTILRRSDDGLKAFAQEYARRRNLIVQAASSDETYKANQAKLLDALDAEIRERVSAFADDCVSLIDKAAAAVSAGDAKLVASGWVKGYEGSSGLSLAATEKQGIKDDIVRTFASAMIPGDAPETRGNASFTVQGQYLGPADFSGRSFYRKLEDSLNDITWKHKISSNMQFNEAHERVNRPINNERAARSSAAWAVQRLDIKGFQWDWERCVTELEDTSAVDRFSGGLKAVLSRFDAAASVHKEHSDLEFDQGATVGEAMKTVASELDEKLLEGGAKTFEKYASRVAEFAGRLSDSQKALLGVMYQDAETLGAENAFKKVDAFARALVTNNFYGFKFEALANPKNLHVLNLLQWFNDDEASTGLSKDSAPQKLSVEERKALLTLKYLPHLVRGDESIQDRLAHALFKQGRADEVARLGLKYQK